MNLAARLAFLVALVSGGTSGQTAPDPGFATTQALAGTKPGTDRWIVHFDKAPYSLDAYRAEMWRRRDVERVEAIVKDIETRMKAGRAGFVQDIEALGGKVTAQWWIVNGCAIEIAPKHLATIKKLDNVAYLQPDAIAVPLIKRAGGASYHQFGGKAAGSGVGIAIIDSAFDANYQHKDIRPHITFSWQGNPKIDRFCHKQRVGVLRFDEPNVNVHGTAVTSCAAGWTWNQPIAGFGAAPEADLACFSIASWFDGSTTFARMATAYNAVAKVAARCRIVASNLSYSGLWNPLSVEQKAGDSLALNADIVVCTAAGNDGPNRVGNSQANINGLSVGAVDVAKRLANYSSRGFQTGRYFPNICAIGSLSMAKAGDETRHHPASGTSFASPIVCGMAADVRAINRALKSDETCAILLCSADAIPDSASTIKVNGVGAGFPRGNVMRALAGNGHHGRETLVRIGQTFTRDIAVQRGSPVGAAIKWHRHDINSTRWANLDLALLRGNNVLVSSDTKFNTEEFVRYRPTRDEILTLRVTLVSLGAGQVSQTFGWASRQRRAKGQRGFYVEIGKGCKGSGSGPGEVVLPAAYKDKMGRWADSYPHAQSNMRYQQVFLGSEIGASRRFDELHLRRDDKFYGRTGDQTITLKLCHTTKDVATLSTSFAANYSETPSTVFSGTLRMRAHSGGGKPDSWETSIKFNKPFTYNGKDNLLVEMINTSAQSTQHYMDACGSSNDATTTRVFAMDANATTATRVSRYYGLVMRLVGSGGGNIPQLGHVGEPVVAQSFQITLSQARPRTTALLWLGARTNVPLPGNCTLYATPDLLLGALVTSASGAASFKLDIPSSRALVKLAFTNQWWVFDKNGALLNALALSNGGVGTIGDTR